MILRTGALLVASELHFIWLDLAHRSAFETGALPPMNVLFVSDTPLAETAFRDGSIRYRCFHMAEALQAAGHLADVTTLDHLDLVNLSRYDVVSVLRPTASRKLLKVLEQCNKRGIRTVADIDELEFDPDVASESPKLLLKDQTLATVRAMFLRQQLALKHFDEVSAATEELARARRVQDPSQAIYVAPNGLSNFWLSCNDQINLNNPTIKRISFFSDVSGVEKDFDEASVAINRILKKKPDSELNVVGPLDLSSSGIENARVIRGAWNDFMNVPRELTKTWVNIAPLQNTRINYAKAHTQFIESAAFGVPIICSPTADLKRHSVDGLHLVETTEQWLEAFDALSDKQYYESCQKALQTYAREHCLATHSVQTLIDRWTTNREITEDESFTSLSAAN